MRGSAEMRGRSIVHPTPNCAPYPVRALHNVMRLDERIFEIRHQWYLRPETRMENPEILPPSPGQLWIGTQGIQQICSIENRL